MPSLVKERIESVKAGVLGAAAFVVADLILVAVKYLLSEGRELSFALLLNDWTRSLPLVIGAISGFLFGITYRYIIRDDRNSHLNDGAVLAFGLVRGLAIVEQNLALSELLSALLLVIQSIACFALARLVLDLAIARKAIEPFI